MSVRRDYYCIVCGTDNHRDVDAPLDALELELLCDECRAPTVHRVVCNGGVGRRYRFHDIGGLEPEDIAFYSGCGTEEEDPNTGKRTPTKDLRTGEVYHDAPRFSSDGIAEKTAKAKFQRRARKGLGRIWSLGTRRAQGMSNG